ncbi:hypothetical protein ABT026_26020 [Streptomyces sp. NPDC002734]|uniref:hypothetical protein n=1 Tax=Streptomyces sp. NPDC002734 TaxID=3154426 RepID=UPI00331FC19D
MEHRPDPIQIITRPSTSVAQDRIQALGAWMDAARHAGWRVDPLDEPVDWPAGECGLVDIEGLRYLLRVGLRGRTRAMLLPAAHADRAVARPLAGDTASATRPVLQLTTWAEPLLDAELQRRRPPRALPRRER